MATIRDRIAKVLADALAEQHYRLDPYRVWKSIDTYDLADAVIKELKLNEKQ